MCCRGVCGGGGTRGLCEGGCAVLLDLRIVAHLRLSIPSSIRRPCLSIPIPSLSIPVPSLSIPLSIPLSVSNGSIPCLPVPCGGLSLQRRCLRMCGREELRWDVSAHAFGCGAAASSRVAVASNSIAVRSSVSPIAPVCSPCPVGASNTSNIPTLRVWSDSG